MKKLARRALVVLRDPLIHPVEVWAVRALLAYMTIHFGLKV